MKKLMFIPALFLLGMVACNSSSDDKAKEEMPAMPEMKVADLPAIPAGAKVFFKNLKDGDVVSSPLKVEFGTEVMSVDSAGQIKAGSGHHHLIIDDGDSIAAGTMVPKDSTHLHFGNAQTETTINLLPGKHRLALQFADGVHRSYGSPLSAAITVEVKK